MPCAECNLETLRRALDETIKKRGSQNILAQYQTIIEDIRKDPTMRGFWDKYRTEFNYAKDIGFDYTCESVLRIMNNIGEG